MMDEALDFLAGLWGIMTQPGFVTLSAIYPDRQHPTPSRHIDIRDREQLAEHLDALLAANVAGWGGFFGVGLRRSNLGRWRRGGRHDLLALPALFVDVDRDGPETLVLLRDVRPPPSAIVHSGGGYHAYWYLDRPTQAFAEAQAALTGLACHTGGDRLTVSQSMRLPSTVNHKRGRRQTVCHVVEHHPDRRYPLRAFASYAEVSTPTAPPRRTTAYTIRQDLNPALIARVVDVLRQDYGGRQQTNGWTAALCPGGHKHDTPGSHFYFNPALGLGHCFGRHGRLLLRDLCPLLGIDSAAYGGIYLNTHNDRSRAYG